MLLLDIMCFSSCILCLLLVAGHGTAVPGHHGHNGTAINLLHRHDHTSDDLKILNSSRNQKTSLSKDHHIEHNKSHVVVSPNTFPKSLQQRMWRKERSTGFDLSIPLPKHHVMENLSSPLSLTNSHIAEESPSSELDKLKESHIIPQNNESYEEDGDIESYNSNAFHPEDIQTHEKDHREIHTSHPCHSHKDVDDHHHDDDHHHHDDDEEEEGSPTVDFHQHHPPKARNISGMVWLYSSLAVIVISLCGLLSVAVIPIMQKWFYHTLLQFLVGLAVGSLSGDGLLHLMPHAILDGANDHDHDDDDNHRNNFKSDRDMEQTAIWRSLAALGGIFLFFIAERMLGVLTSYRRRKLEAKLSRLSKDLPVMQGEEGANNGNVGEKLAQPKKNSYDRIKEKDEKETIQMLQTETTPTRKGSGQSNHEVGFHGRSSFSFEPDIGVSYRPDFENSVIVSEHHGHGHGHSHDIPQSVSAVAWMVIMGDGLHNFCDGLAIGAAFASGPADGVSTTVAVFCHELPHELGDFAMLLKTGMKVKQALFYNGLSSILCFVGMIIGVLLGNVNSATNWVFAGTAGMFLYIALVDMLPELTTGKEFGLAAITTLAVQTLGICMGISIMLLIAIYEHQLRTIVS